MERKFSRTVEQSRPLGNLTKQNKNKDFDLAATTITEKQKNKDK